MSVGGDLTVRRETACQELLRSSDLVSGWLRQKTKLHKLSDVLDRKTKGSNFQSLSTLFSWERRFVVLKDGFAYFYGSETAKKTTKLLDLGAFKSVQIEQLKAKDVAWPFRIVNYTPTKDLFLGASSQDDQQHWMTALQKGIDAAVAAGRKGEPPPEPGQTTPSADHQNSSSEDEYDTISDMSPGEWGTKGRGGGGGGGGDCSEYELVPTKGQTIRDRPVPPAPVENSSDSGGSGGSAGPPKPKPKPFGTKPKPASQATPPISARIQPVPRVGPKTPLPPSREVDDDVEVEYELEETLYTQALWLGDSDKGIQLLRSVKEEGVFMIRRSTTGNGDQTLQVTVKGEVKKYKLTKEGGSYRMADGKTFGDILDLLNYYQSHNIPNYDTKLKKPYKHVSKQ